MNSKSTHKLITVVVCLLCLAIFSCSVFGATTYNAPDVSLFLRNNYYFNDADSNRLGGFKIEATSFTGEVVSYDSYDQGSNANPRYVGTVKYHYQYRINLFFYNLTGEWLKINVDTTNYTFKLVGILNDSTTSNNQTWSWSVNDPNVDHLVFNSNDTVTFSIGGFQADDGQYYLPPYYNYSYVFYMDLDLTERGNWNFEQSLPFGAPTCNISGIQLTSPVIDDNFVIRTITNPNDPGSKLVDYDIHKMSNNVQSILDAYTQNVQGAEDLSSDITSNDEKLANIHENESQWYSQNSQAIESTGLSNFEFTENQSSALTGVFSLFQRLWTALGDYTFVITFSLMMAFATFFLRHNPIKKTSYNNYSSKGGKQSGSSSG